MKTPTAPASISVHDIMVGMVIDHVHETMAYPLDGRKPYPVIDTHRYRVLAVVDTGTTSVKIVPALIRANGKESRLPAQYWSDGYARIRYELVSDK